MVNPKVGNLLAVSCAVGLGVVTGLYTFGPAFEEEAQKKRDSTALKDGLQKPVDSETQASIKAAQQASQEAATTAALAAKSAKEAVKTKFEQGAGVEKKAVENVVEKVEEKKD